LRNDLDTKWKKAIVEIAEEFKKSNQLKRIEIEDALERRLNKLKRKKLHAKKLLEEIGRK